MIKHWLSHHCTGLVAAVGIALFFRFLLLPTAELFFSAYHSVKIEALYVGYQIFKVAGYYMSVWDYRNLAAWLIAGGVLLCYLGFKWRRQHAGVAVAVEEKNHETP